MCNHSRWLLAGVLDPIKRARFFVQLWTLKEAYVKALGQGISAAPGLKGFSLVLEQDSSIQHSIRQQTASSIADTAYRIHFVSEHTMPNTSPSFMLFSPSEGHVAALCMQRHWADGACVNRQPSEDSVLCGSTPFDDIEPDNDGASHSEPKSSVYSRNLPMVRFFQTIPLVSEHNIDCEVLAGTAQCSFH